MASVSVASASIVSVSVTVVYSVTAGGRTAACAMRPMRIMRSIMGPMLGELCWRSLSAICVVVSVCVMISSARAVEFYRFKSSLSCIWMLRAIEGQIVPGIKPNYQELDRPSNKACTSYFCRRRCSFTLPFVSSTDASRKVRDKEQQEPEVGSKKRPIPAV